MSNEAENKPLQQPLVSRSEAELFLGIEEIIKSFQGEMKRQWNGHKEEDKIIWIASCCLRTILTQKIKTEMQ